MKPACRLALAAIAALIWSGSAFAQGEAPRSAGSPAARPPVDVSPPPCSSVAELVKLDGLLRQWNQAYQPLQLGITTELAASNAEALAQADEARAKDQVSSAQSTVLDLQTEIGVRERQIRSVEDSLKASDASDRLSDRDYVADRQKLLGELQTMIAKVRDGYARAKSDLTKAETGLQSIEDRLKSADQGFGDSARESFQALQADKTAEDAFQIELISQRARTCPASQTVAAATPSPPPPGPAPSPEPAPAVAAPPVPLTESPPPTEAQQTPPPALPPSLAEAQQSPPTASPPPAEPQAAASPEATPTAAPESAPPSPEAAPAASPPAAGSEATAPVTAEAGAPAASCSASKLESDVLATINKARTGPPAFIKVLEPDFGGGSYSDAKKFLKGRKPISPLACDGRLEAAAHKLLADQGPLGGEAHTGSDGSEPWQRMQAAGVSAQLYAEEISVTFPTALGVVSELLIDPQAPRQKSGPGAAPLVHPIRLDLMNADLAVAGVACGPNKKYKVMCVVDLSSRPQPPGS